MASEDLSNFSMFELFRLEAETQKEVLTNALIELERDPTSAAFLEELMRASHSLKGAAQIVGQMAAVKVAHAMEDAFVAAQEGKIVLKQTEIDLMLVGVDLLIRIANTPESTINIWEGVTDEATEIEYFLANIEQMMLGETSSNMRLPLKEIFETTNEDKGVKLSKLDEVIQSSNIAQPLEISEPISSLQLDTQKELTSNPPAKTEKNLSDQQRSLRITADHLNRLLSLTGESLVESRQLRPFIETMQRLKRHHSNLVQSLDDLRQVFSQNSGTTITASERQIHNQLVEAQNSAIECREFLTDRLSELEILDRRSVNLSQQLYSEAIACRMRPFSDGIHGFSRMIRDISKSLGKEIRFEIKGQQTQVDRDILDCLEAPLSHLLRNAVDHGIEFPEERIREGKKPEGTIQIEARHSAGKLLVTISDDGYGINLEKLKHTILKQQLSTAVLIEKFSETELLEFLFLPGFTMKESVTEISGRGVGLDVVQTMLKAVRGTIRVISQFGQGTRFQLQLPLTLSVVRALIVESSKELYAFPLAYINRTLKLPKSSIQISEGCYYFSLNNVQIGLVHCSQILEQDIDFNTNADELSIVILGEGHKCYGITVDRFVAQRELVVHPLDPWLGKVRNVSAGALIENGDPILILDIEDVMRSIEKLIIGGRLNQSYGILHSQSSVKSKRILVVDDSLTVRELERKFLDGYGYRVEVAVDGMDGWNAIRASNFDLIITDIDMPRLDGIELVKLIRADVRIKSLPIMIISYKDREEDRRRGLEAGADYYLTKSSFHDDSLLEAVIDLIGEP